MDDVISTEKMLGKTRGVAEIMKIYIYIYIYISVYVSLCRYLCMLTYTCMCIFTFMFICIQYVALVFRNTR